jgi:hypothetical protein
MSWKDDLLTAEKANLLFSKEKNKPREEIVPSREELDFLKRILDGIEYPASVGLKDKSYAYWAGSENLEMRNKIKMLPRICQLLIELGYDASISYSSVDEYFELYITW